jgi:CRP/FNR family transcriptional regulator, cyclic AMP receptor protein
MASPSAVRLLDVDPDIGRYLTPEELEDATGLVVPVLRLPEHNADVVDALERIGAFGALVIRGMVIHQLRIGDQVAARLLGSGDIVTVAGAPQSMLLSESRCRTAAPTELALLGKEVLAAAHRWPRIVAGLQSRLAQQSDRLATQLVICQLPRVDQRLLAMMWLLAESWGRVTSSGTSLPVSLTHETLGALIGARRPTVTLALRELTERGAVVRQDRGWLLLELPPEPSADVVSIRAPKLIEEVELRWADDQQLSAAGPTDVASQFQALREVVSELQTRHLRSADAVRERLELLQMIREQCMATHERCSESLERLQRARLSRALPPSS